VRPFVYFNLLLVTACAPSLGPAPLRAPNPNGCYAIIYERPDFSGAADMLNGPVRLATLERMPQTNYPDWESRIRSLRVGRAATLTVYTESGFRGSNRQFTSDSELPRLDESVSGQIKSLQLVCVARPGPP
jgi:hypothetical protein